MSDKYKVVTVEIDAKVGGESLGVQEATITLGVNAIPMINLVCVPTEVTKDASSTDVKSPHIKDFASLYDSLSSKAEDMSATGDVSITVDTDGSTDSISLSGWILTGAGLSSVGATQAPCLSVVLQHPICRLTKVGSIYEEPKTEYPKMYNEKLASASSFLDVVEAAYKYVREDVDYWPVPDDSPAPSFRSSLGTGDFDPKKYLEGGSAGIFLSSAGAERIAQAIGRMVIPNGGGTSTWDMLMAASGNLLLSIVQDESNNYTTEKLVIEPTQPWKKSNISLDEDSCHSTEIPGMDPFKIIGVMCRKLGPYSDVVQLGLLGNGNINQKDPVSEVMYAPVKDATSADGRIMKTNAPVVLDSAFRRDAPNGGAINLGMVKMEATRADLYNDALMKYCQAVYEISALSMKTATSVMKLGFHDSGGSLILPGQGCSFSSQGSTLFYGYIRNVIHYMSTAGGCETIVKMSHVRSSEGLGDIIAAGATNAAYE